MLIQKNRSKNHLQDAMPKWQPFSENSQAHQILTNILIATDILSTDVAERRLTSRSMRYSVGNYQNDMRKI